MTGAHHITANTNLYGKPEHHPSVLLHSSPLPTGQLMHPTLLELLFILLCGCCRRTLTRTRDAESTVRLFLFSSYSSNFFSLTRISHPERLLAPPTAAPVVDHQTLSESLAGIARAKEGVTARAPFIIVNAQPPPPPPPPDPSSSTATAAPTHSTMTIILFPSFVFVKDAGSGNRCAREKLMFQGEFDVDWTSVRLKNLMYVQYC
ncbi:hypothetical protein DFH09DRAFT_1368612 [Mycena vulgaris]|nr:hypothetical protein DFH09DRAFT_1368612 [Mycena vulgaris]